MKKALLALLGLALLLSFCGAALFVGEISKPESSEASYSTPDLNTRVWDMGTYFKVQNRDSFTWTNVRLELNSGLIAGGYTVKVGNISSGAMLKVGAARFTKSSGQRFNPFTHEPVIFGIWCDQGYHYGEW